MKTRKERGQWSPLPLKVSGTGHIVANGLVICGDMPLEYAELLVRAVNSHEALLEAAKKAKAMIDPKDTHSKDVYLCLVRAIAQAEGVQHNDAPAGGSK